MEVYLFFCRLLIENNQDVHCSTPLSNFSSRDHLNCKYKYKYKHQIMQKKKHIWMHVYEDYANCKPIQFHIRKKCYIF